MTLEILTSPALAPLRHGFFTRAGGASSGVFAGLNCGQGSSDQSEIVTINRTRVAQAMGVPLDLAGAALRISLGWSTTETDIERCLKSWEALFRRKSSASAIWTGASEKV